MVSTTIKRSVATLGVVAGLLAAAVPASAIDAKSAADVERDAVKAPSQVDSGPGDDNVKAPTASRTSAGADTITVND